MEGTSVFSSEYNNIVNLPFFFLHPKPIFRLCSIFFAGVAQTGNIDVQYAGHGDLQANSMLRYVCLQYSDEYDNMNVIVLLKIDK